MTILRHAEFERLTAQEKAAREQEHRGADPHSHETDPIKADYLQSLIEFGTAIRDPDLYEDCVISLTLRALALILDELPAGDIIQSCVRKAVDQFQDQTNVRLSVPPDDFARITAMLCNYPAELTIDCDFDLRPAEAIMTVLGRRIHIGAKQQLANLKLSMLHHE